VVPAGSTLVAYTSSSTTGAGSCGTFTGSSSGGTSLGSAGTQLSGTTTPGATKRPVPSLRSREAALLRRELLLHTTVKNLLARHRITLGVATLTAGRLTFVWVFAPVGRRTAPPMRIAVAIRMKRAGTAEVTLRLGAAVMRELRRAHHGFKVVGTAAFTPKGGRSVAVGRSFRIGT
jgi:hypothetical protein